MKNMNNRINLLPTLARISPVLFLLATFFNMLLQPSLQSIYLFSAYIILVFSNWIAKNIFVKPLYKILDKTKLPILGIGNRPSGANSCQFTLDNIKSISFGMPSGHSQIAWAVATYLILKIHMDKLIYIKTISKESNYIWEYSVSIFLAFVAGCISFSRVYIDGCHTLEQVIVGGILGIVSGYIIYYIENKYII